MSTRHPPKSVLLTGITGALGSWLAKAAISSGARVCALVRGSATDGRRRAEQSLCVTGIASTDLLDTVAGDILLPGVAAPEHLPQDLDLIVHCAACTEFRDDASRQTHQTNVDGVRHMLEVATERRVPFVHVSTAYVAGRRTGRVLENELDTGQTFNNDYERTKFEGERLVHEWSRQTGLRAIVLRPSIVAGDWQTGRALRFNTFYDMMHALDVIGPASGERLCIQAEPSATKNLIPVDYFAEVAWRLIQHGETGTYHIVHPNPITLDRLREIFSELFNLQNVTLVRQSEFTRLRLNHAERICHRVMSPYRPYMNEPEPEFDTSATDAALAGSGVMTPPIDLAWFARLLTYARQVNWHGAAQPPSKPSSGGDEVIEYFETFLPNKIGRSLLPDLRRLSARIGIVMREDCSRHWALDVHEGVLRTISTNGMPTDCRFEIDQSTFLEIVSARMTPQAAFFERRVELSGDVAVGLKSAAIMAQFFKRFPFSPSRS
jgi:nucleoside-diphosphate-sugar epimerase